MIRLGACVSPADMPLMTELGFDFIEINLTWLHDLSEEEYARQLKQAHSASIGVEAANCMVPGRIKLTGPDADDGVIRAYLEKAMARAHELGVKLIVFGSGGARHVPDGWPQAAAWRQIAHFLAIAEEYCAKYDITLAIEPLRRLSCNILNLVTEGTLMSAVLGLPHVGVLGDNHHMLCEREPMSALTQAGRLLRHVHISHVRDNEEDRDWPAAGDGTDYEAIFAALKAGGYDGRVSIEAGCSDMRADGKKAFDVLDACRR